MVGGIKTLNTRCVVLRKSPENARKQGVFAAVSAQKHAIQLTGLRSCPDFGILKADVT
jgi:hypothetical protein